MPAIPEKDRARQAHDIREMASTLSTTCEYSTHIPNQDERPPYIFSFTKGLEHKTNGLVANPSEFENFIWGTETHDPRAFGQVLPNRKPFLAENGTTPPHGDLDDYRRWESPTSGHAFVLQGADPHAITMPPAPAAGSAEFAAEMAELYQMALLRDVPIAAFMAPDLVSNLSKPDGTPVSKACLSRLTKANARVGRHAQRLGGMRWFAGLHSDGTQPALQRRRRFGQTPSQTTMFRGMGGDPWDTPFLSQFLVMGSGGKKRCFAKRATAFIEFGAQRIHQSVRVARPNVDYMTNWVAWLNVQNGANRREQMPQDAEFHPGQYRVMSRLLDMATYVHDDQLYQAYLNAALLLLSERYSFDRGLPYHKQSETAFPFPGAQDGDDNRASFALFGAPHLLSLLAEVSGRALKAVRLQKFAVHRRMRPEAAGALFHTIYTDYHPDRDIMGSIRFPLSNGAPEAVARRRLGATLATYAYRSPDGTPPTEPALDRILNDIRLHNADQKSLGQDTWLLPMAYPEGSPMHPSYGSGHATVAGACVTLLKAFFDMGQSGNKAMLVNPGQMALVPDGGTSAKDCSVDLLCTPVAQGLTLEGELNKLMWNVSIARSIAGTNYYSDYIEAALQGEAITLSILREQMLTHHHRENVTMTVPLLVKRTLPKALLTGSAIAPEDEVSVVKIRSDGTLEKVI